MSDAGAARILPGQGTQSELIALEDLPDCIFAGEEAPGYGEPQYTAERFFSRRPDDYRLCCTFLAAGLGLLKIARLLKVHHQTVAAVRDREGSQIDIEKERIRKNIRLAVGIASERLPDIMATLPAGQVPLSTAILLDKLAQLDGEPTQRVEHTFKGHLTHEALAARITEFPDAIDVQATDLSADKPGQKAPTAAAPGTPASDTESGKPTS